MKKKVPDSVNNIVRKGEIACNKVFHSYICIVRQNVVLSGDGLSNTSIFTSWLL